MTARGSLLHDRYELGEVVGHGGMGSVHRAVDTRLSRTVAVKVLREGPDSDTIGRARMRSEAHLAASIFHPGVAQVFDFVEGESGADSDLDASSFIVMQFVEGHSLAQLLKDRGPMPPDEVMSVVAQVAEGLQAVHEAGIVHRDLKPANIMLTPAGRTVLVDFGIARASSSEMLTQTGTMVGTADYMSPEQAGGASATPRSDLYALGVVAHHCLTGTSPFRRESHIATALAHVTDDAPPLPPAVPGPVARIVSDLMARDPADRPESAAAVAARAREIGAASSIDVSRTFALAGARGPEDEPTAVGTTPPMPPVPASAGEPSSHEVLSVRRRRGRPLAWAAVAVLALMLGAVAYQVLGSGTPTVPDVVGLPLDEASQRIQDAGLEVRASTVDVAGTPAEQVTEQSPRAGTEASEGGVVEVTVASGRVLVPSRRVIGQPYAEAAGLLEGLGFQVVRKDVVRAAGAGKVVALNRSGRIPDGATITLSVAVAPATPQPSDGSSGSSGSSGSGSGGDGAGAKDNDKPSGKGSSQGGKGKKGGKGKG